MTVVGGSKTPDHFPVPLRQPSFLAVDSSPECAILVKDHLFVPEPLSPLLLSFTPILLCPGLEEADVFSSPTPASKDRNPGTLPVFYLLHIAPAFPLGWVVDSSSC